MRLSNKRASTLSAIIQGFFKEMLELHKPSSVPFPFLSPRPSLLFPSPPLPSLSPSIHVPFPSPPLPPLSPFLPVPSLPLPLEVGPLIAAMEPGRQTVFGEFQGKNLASSSNEVNELQEIFRK